LKSGFQPDSIERLTRLGPILGVRSKLLRVTRQFFYERDFLEVETPIRIPAPALELHIDAEPAGNAFLRTSPELHMKRLLAAGHQRIFQLGPCFRRGERGDRHHPEYSMLEWYRANADYNDILVDTKALITRVARDILGGMDLVYGGKEISLSPIWERITVADAFKRFAGWDPSLKYEADRFDLDLVEKVEPQLPWNIPVILTDYPVEAAALARRKPGAPHVAERWELFIGGLELANAYSELNDPDEQRARFEACAWQRKELGKVVYPMDEEFLSTLANAPPSGGIALGIDRLMMLITNSTSLDNVLPFRE
jgi:elongation factor P--(R)-beta-lysine ligase